MKSEVRGTGVGDGWRRPRVPVEVGRGGGGGVI